LTDGKLVRGLGSKSPGEVADGGTRRTGGEPVCDPRDPPRTTSAIEREALLRAILETSPDGLITIDEGAVIRSFNPAAERMFGYRAEEVVGRNVSCLMPAPFRDQHDTYVTRYLETGEARIIGIGREVLGQRKDGTIFPLDLAVGEVHEHGTRLFAGFVRDISARHEAARRLHDLQTELLHVSRLSAMGEMASALAHELNQPLTAIMNYIRACRRMLGAGETERLPRALELMDKTVDQAARAGQIIQHLRRFIASGETERSLEPLSEVVEEAARLALIGASARGIAALFELERDLPPVMIDKIQIQQVVINLVRNAVDVLADAPRREITIRTRRPAPDWVEVTVSDSGPGLPAAVAERLFEPFVTTKPQGMGIGLSISHSIIEGHGGSLGASANPGGGTTFRFTLPVGDGAETPS